MKIINSLKSTLEISVPSVAYVNPNRLVVGPLPCQLRCPGCHASVVTRITSTPGAFAWMVGGGLCAVGYAYC